MPANPHQLQVDDDKDGADYEDDVDGQAMTVDDGAALFADEEEEEEHQAGVLLPLGIERSTQPVSATGSSAARDPSCYKKVLQRIGGLLLMAASGVVFSFVTFAASMAAEGGFTPLEITFWRFVGQMAACGVGLLIRWQTPVVPRPEIKLVVFRSVAGTTSVLLLYFAFTMMLYADAIVVFFTNPVLTSVLAFFVLKEAFTRWDFLAVLLSMAGTVLVAQPPFLFGHNELNGTSHIIGTVLCLLSAIMAACALLSLRKIKGTSPLVTTFWYGWGGILISATMVFVDKPWKFPDEPMQYVYLSVTGVLGCVGQVMLAASMQLEKAGPAAMMRYLDVVLAFIYQITLQHHPATLLEFLGACLVIGCAVVVTVKAYFSAGEEQAASNYERVQQDTDDTQETKPVGTNNTV